MCIGQRFGLLEVKAALHLMLRRYRWSVPADYRMPYQHVPIARPTDGLPLRLERLR
jgi:cytochrome P450